MILVLGGKGTIGRALVARAAATGAPLTALGHAEADVTDPKATAVAVARHRPAVIVNAAAFTDLDQAEAQPAAAQRVNALGAAVVAAAAKRASVPIIHISTDMVFDGEKTGFYTEEDPVGARTVFGRSKAMGEEGVRNANASHLILRPGLLYAADGDGFLQNVLKLCAERDAFDVAADQRGSPTSAADFAEAVMLVAVAAGKRTIPWGTYHFAGAGETSLHGFASAIVALQAPYTGRVPMVNVSTAASAAVKRPANTALDSTRLAEVLGLRPDDWHLSLDKVVRQIFETKKLPEV